MLIKDIVIMVGVLAGIYVNLIFQDSLADPAADEWQLQHLHQPSSAQRSAEQSGRIIIYDGIESEEIEQALDRQFERIDAMMFVRTRYPQPQGGYESDDDCD